MSIVIVDDHLYTPQEVSYLEARNRYHEIEANRKTYGPGGPREGQEPSNDDDDVLELDRDIYEYVVGLNVKQVQAAVRKAGFEPTGNEHELKSLLAQHLQMSRDAERKH